MRVRRGDEGTIPRHSFRCCHRPALFERCKEYANEGQRALGSINSVDRPIRAIYRHGLHAPQTFQSSNASRVEANRRSRSILPRKVRLGLTLKKLRGNAFGKQKSSFSSVSGG